MPTRYGSSGGLMQQGTSLLLSQSPMRLLNPYGGKSMLGQAAPLGAHMSNVPYNPYGFSADPRVMARPTIEPIYSSNIQPSGITAMQRGREPTLYSSVSCVNRIHFFHIFGHRTERTSSTTPAHHIHTTPIDSIEVTTTRTSTTSKAWSYQSTHKFGKLTESSQQQWTSFTRHSNDIGGLWIWVSNVWWAIITGTIRNTNKVADANCWRQSQTL